MKIENDTIRTNWRGWNDGDKCPLCLCEGEGIANIYKKGHTRRNGIMLESGISYCEKCANLPESETHWNNWWKEEWKKSEERAEKNWEEHGMYTNMGGWAFEFAYAKTPDGLKRYLEVFPDCPRHKLERLITHIKYSKISMEEQQKQIAEAITDSIAPDSFKKIMIKESEDWFKFLKEHEGA